MPSVNTVDKNDIGVLIYTFSFFIVFHHDEQITCELCKLENGRFIPSFSLYPYTTNSTVVVGKTLPSGASLCCLEKGL